MDAPSGIDATTPDGIFLKRIELPAGSIVSQHIHIWGHSTLVASGRLLVWREGVPDRHYEAGDLIWIPAGIGHEFQILENTVLYCIHNLHGAEAVEILREHGLEDWKFENV